MKFSLNQKANGELPSPWVFVFIIPLNGSDNLLLAIEVSKLSDSQHTCCKVM